MKSWSSFSQELTEKKANKDYDGDGKIESGSKEHAGVVHNAIQRAKGKKADGQDTRKEEVEGLEETKLADKAYSRARDEGAQRRRTKEYKQGLNRSTTRKEKGMYRLATAQRRTDADLERQKATYDTGAHKGDWDRAKRAKKYKKEEFELVDERYKGKHGQSEKEYKDDRSQGGKMVSGDSKMSGAEYTHGRRVKAANPGSQPDEGGKTKPKSQGRMDKGTRADLEYRKANLKKKEQKEEVELQELDIKGAVTGALDRGSKFMKKNPVGRAVSNVLKPVGSGRGTARPSPAGGGATTRPMMNSHEPEGDLIGEGETPMGQHPGKSPDKKVRDKYETQRRRTEAPAGVGVPDRSVGYGQLKQSFEIEGDNLQEKPGDGYLGPTPIPNPIRMAKDAVDATNRNSQKKVDMVNKTLGRGSASMPKVNYFNKGPSAASKRYLGLSYEPEGGLVEGIRDKDPEKGTEERKKRLEKKRGHKVDDHPEYSKESVTPGQPAEKLKTGRKMFTIPDEERSAAAARLKEKARKKREEKMKEELEIKEGSCGSSKKKKKTYKEEAESKAQQRLMGLALSVKRGDTPMSSVTPQVARMAREMKEKDLKDFAGTKHDGLPEKVKKEEPEVSSPLVESLVESAVQRMVAKARRETAADKRLNRQASSAQQRAELNAKK